MDEEISVDLTAVPVLAEPRVATAKAESEVGGEARESAKPKEEPGQDTATPDSRGGSRKLSRKEYMRRYMEKKRLITKIGHIGRNDIMRVGGDVWDSGKYPDKTAWEVAVARASRALKYAEMFPGKVSTAETMFQTIEYQYQNEGLPSILRPDKVIL